MFVGKVSSLTLLFKSAYFAWEYILLEIGKNSFREKYGKYLCFWNNIYNR